MALLAVKAARNKRETYLLYTRRTRMCSRFLHLFGAALRVIDRSYALRPDCRGFLDKHGAKPFGSTTHIPLNLPSAEGGGKRKRPASTCSPKEGNCRVSDSEGWIRRMFSPRTAKQVRASRRDDMRDKITRRCVQPVHCMVRTSVPYQYTGHVRTPA